MNIDSTQKRIQEQKETYPILLYMKGSLQAPRCGFSNQVIRILEDLQVKFHSVDVLEDPDIRTVLPQVSKWPTFPQLYVKGELIGGCDIISSYDRAKLKEILTV